MRTREQSINALQVALVAIGIVGLTAVSVSAAPTVLFADTFDRADNDDLNAVATGKSGTLGALDWLEKAATGGGRILSNELQLGEDGGGGGWALAYLDHNFVDSGILSAGGFSVSVDILNDVTGGGTRYVGIAVGGSSADYSGWSNNNPADQGADFYVGYDGSGTEQFRIWTNGVLATTTSLTFANPDTLRVDLTVTDFNAGTTVGYEVFNNSISVASGNFTWGGTDENYLGLFSNWTDSGAELDNFEISAVLDPYVALSSTNVVSNAPPGTLVGTLAMGATSATFTYSLAATGDYTVFDIPTGTTNLRTSAWIDSASYDISIIGTESGGGGLVVTNDFTIGVDPALSGAPTFMASAEVQTGSADGTLVGTAQTVQSGATFSISGGREDLFYLDGADLKVTNSADWGSIGTTNYVMLQAVVGTGTNELAVAVNVVNTAASGTIFLFH